MLKRSKILWQVALIVALAVAFGAWVPDAAAQRTQRTENFEDDPEAAEALEAQEAEQQRQREQEQQRRRGPNMATISFDTPAGAKKVSVQYGDWPTEGADYDAIAGTKSGEVIRGTMNAALKLKTDSDLRFGEVLIKKENVAKSYPGVYSLWVRKTDEGWNLVFNEKADVWGTMHDPASDVAEIAIDYKDTEEPTDAMRITLEDGDGGALLRIVWGRHQWVTAFEPAS